MGRDTTDAAEQGECLERASTCDDLGQRMSPNSREDRPSARKRNQAGVGRAQVPCSSYELSRPKLARAALTTSMSPPMESRNGLEV